MHIDKMREPPPTCARYYRPGMGAGSANFQNFVFEVSTYYFVLNIVGRGGIKYGGAWPVVVVWWGWCLGWGVIKK